MLYDLLTETFTSEFVSPYALAETLSKLTGTVVRPQMTYQYVARGWIASVTGPTGKKMVARDTAIDWSVKYLTKNRPDFVATITD